MFGLCTHRSVPYSLVQKREGSDLNLLLLRFTERILCIIFNLFLRHLYKVKCKIVERVWVFGY